MSVINDGEILARIHKFKMFRKEGNLFIDIYEALLGKPAYKFIAVPNLMIQEADKKYFGFGESKASALSDCLKKIKGVPIHQIVPQEYTLGHEVQSGVLNASDSEPLDTFERGPGSPGTRTVPAEGVAGGDQTGLTHVLEREEEATGSVESEKPVNRIPGKLGTIRGSIFTYPQRPDGTITDIISSRNESRKGEPVQNAKIIARCKGVGKRKTRTDESGYYELTGLADGVWKLKLKAKGFEPEQAMVEISGGGVYEENFE